jgi:cytochrome c oxidase subunit II
MVFNYTSLTRIVKLSQVLYSCIIHYHKIKYMQKFFFLTILMGGLILAGAGCDSEPETRPSTRISGEVIIGDDVVIDKDNVEFIGEDGFERDPDELKSSNDSLVGKDDDGVAEVLNPKDGNCTANFDPLCGTDGKTYTNSCLLKLAKVELAYEGECKSREELPPREKVSQCTSDAKICPDGSSVGRSGSNCEFAPCKAEDVAPVESDKEPLISVTPLIPVEVKKFEMVAKQWEFQPKIITVKKGDNVQLEIKSVDVDHGFALSEFGINKQLAPGETTVVKFIATKTGTFPFFCNVFCGHGHASMRGNLVIEE